MQGETIEIVVNRSSGFGTPCLEAFSPSGLALQARQCAITGAKIAVTLNSTGPHTILISEQNNNRAIGYQISLQCADNCQSTGLQDLSNCVQPSSLNLLPGSTAIIQIGNNGIPGCSIATAQPYSVTVDIYNGDSWLTVSPLSGTLSPGQVAELTVSMGPVVVTETTVLQALIRIAAPATNIVYNVPVVSSLTPGLERLSLSGTSFLLQSVTGTPAPLPQTLLISTISEGLVGLADELTPNSWTIEGPLPSWLDISPLYGVAGGTAGIAEAIISVDPTGLSPGVLTHLVPINGEGVANNPQFISVTYYVVAPTAAPTPLFSEYSLIFRVGLGSSGIFSKQFQMSNTGGQVISAAFSWSTASGGNWLSVSPGNADTLSGPDTIQTNVNPTGLGSGIYRGTITATPSAREPQEIQVLLIVLPVAAAVVTRADTALEGCTPLQMALSSTTVGNGLNAPVSFPQLLLAQVVDNCGEGVEDATVVATVEGISISMPSVDDGFYSGTWTLLTSSGSTTLTFSVLHPVFAAVQEALTVSTVAASGGTVLPVLFNEGIVEGAGFTPLRPLVPGGIVSLFGSNLAPATAAATQIPLERELQQVSVRIGNVDAPLYFVSEGQINAQIPFEVQTGDTVPIVINNGGLLTAPQLYQIAPAQPGIFKAQTNAAILDEQFQLVTSQNPARIGSVIQIFGSGLGLTNPVVASGAAGVASDTLLPLNVTIGGIQAAVQYKGLAPNFVGLYQVNVTVPNGVAPGDEVPLVIEQDGISSNPILPISIPVQP